MANVRKTTADKPTKVTPEQRLQDEIVRRERIEQELRTAKQAAEHANAAKDEFLGRISHELRTPLTPVLLGLSDLCARPGLDQDIRDELAMLQQHVEMEATLIDDLLNLTQMTSRRPILHPLLLNLHETINSAISSCRPDLDRNGIRFTTDFSADDAKVIGDSVMLEQVIWNLLSNAAKFTPSGGHVQIHTRNTVQGSGPRRLSTVFIEIIDDGIGIEPELLSRMFMPFTKGKQQLKGMPDGFGIGLAYSRNIIEAHQGTITIHSDGPGKGTSVRVTIPTAQAGAKTALPAPGTTKSEARNLRVLVVEDHRATARLLSALLQRDGHQVILASTIAEAREEIARGEFDLLLSDLGLPDGHGVELPPLIHQTRNTPCIALSGYGQEKDIQRTQEAGFMAHLVKPVTVAKLRQTISTVLEGSIVR